MNIIIVGIGKVGYKLADALSDENNDVTVIDKDGDALQRASDNLDVMCITGNCASVRTLIEAGIREADILIAVTASDEINMVCCLMAKKLGAKHTIARIRELYYHEEIQLLKEELELDLVINPEEAAAWEISKKLKYSSAVFVESFAHGGADLVAVDIDGENLAAGKSLMEISGEIDANILIVAVSRGDAVIVPGGNFVVNSGDTIYVMGTLHHISEYCKKTCVGVYHENRVKNIMIIGGGKIAGYLTDLVKSAGIKAKVIERNEEKCLDFAERLVNGIVIRGDGTDEELLLSENLEDMDAFISLTGHDEDNLMSSLLAIEHKVPKVITKITRQSYSQIVKKLGIKSVVSPMVITANVILKFVRSLQGTYGNYVESLHKILGKKAEILEFKIGTNSLFVNIPLRQLNIKKGVLVATIIRDKEIIIPHGDDTVKIGDHVVIITGEPLTVGLNETFLNGGRK